MWNSPVSQHQNERLPDHQTVGAVQIGEGAGPHALQASHRLTTVWTRDGTTISGPDISLKFRRNICGAPISDTYPRQECATQIDRS